MWDRTVRDLYAKVPRRRQVTKEEAEEAEDRERGGVQIEKHEPQAPHNDVGNYENLSFICQFARISRKCQDQVPLFSCSCAIFDMHQAALFVFVFFLYTH